MGFSPETMYPNREMDGWLDGYMDGYVDGYMDGCKSNGV